MIAAVNGGVSGDGHWLLHRRLLAQLGLIADLADLADADIARYFRQLVLFVERLFLPLLRQDVLELVQVSRDFDRVEQAGLRVGLDHCLGEILGRDLFIHDVLSGGAGFGPQLQQPG